MRNGAIVARLLLRYSRKAAACRVPSGFSRASQSAACIAGQGHRQWRVARRSIPAESAESCLTAGSCLITPRGGVGLRVRLTPRRAPLDTDNRTFGRLTRPSEASCTATTSARPSPARRRTAFRRAGRLRPARRRRRADRAARLDARGLPQDADPPDRPARALRDHRHAAGGQLDHPRPEPAPQGDPDGQGAGRGRPRSLPVRRGRDPRRRPRRSCSTCCTRAARSTPASSTTRP